MKATMYQTENFETKLAENLAKEINTLSNTLFELFGQLKKWVSQKRELEYEYRDYISADKAKKNGWLFFLLVLLPILGIIDYASVAQFIAYLVHSSGGGILGFILSFVGWLLFILLELATGWLLLYSKGKPVLKVFGIVIAIILIVLPAYLVFTTYDINPNKTELLYRKTIALVIVSVIVHAIFFAVIKDVWAGIHYVIYLIKNKLLNAKHPHTAMKEVSNRLQSLYIDFDKYTTNCPPAGKTTLLHNRAWYIKRKITTGVYDTQYDFSDYNQNTSYTGSRKEQKQDNNTYQYTIKP